MPDGVWAKPAAAAVITKRKATTTLRMTPAHFI